MRSIAPSVLSADFANLQRDTEMLNRSEAGLIHVDIMDGVFVPNISFGLPVCAAIHRHATKPLDVHLMIVEPDRYIEGFRAAGANIITVHYEACTHLNRTLQHITETGALPGVAVNPHTPVELLSEVLHQVSLVLVMSVNPGFGGQKFIENSYKKIEKLAKMRQDAGADFLIEVDGGVTTENAEQLFNAGADVLVAGSFVFNSPHPENAIKALLTHA